jgi:hypothetical protein
VSGRSGLVAVLALVAAQGLWNAAAQPGFWGYDEGAHAGFALAIREGGLPHPLSGWVTFHPPAAHLVAAAAWAIAEPLGPRASLVALRLPSLCGALALVAASFWLARRLGASDALALCAALLAGALPPVQLAASMIGNEAFAAGAAAVALCAVVRLQEDPRRMRAALVAGAFAGLAAATKYSGLSALAICALPFLRRDLDARALRTGALCAAAGLAVAGPVYLRNVVTTGTPLPMTRTEVAPMVAGEAVFDPGPRRLADYVSVPMTCGQHPYVQVIAEGGLVAGLDPAMRSVPCLVYTGLWFDPFGVRATRLGPRDGVGWGMALLYAGLVPSGLVALGFARMALRSVRSRGRAPEAPLVLASALGAGSFLAFTWMIPSLVAAKSSYLLPLVAPAAAAFTQGCALLPTGARCAGVLLSLCAAALAVVVFTTGVVFEPAPREISLAYWTRVGMALPGSWIPEAAQRLLAR